MIRIGLTGGIGCGKSTVTDLFAQHGIPIIDADKIAHELTDVGQPLTAQITKQFGDAALKSHGHLNRKKLREIVFEDNDAKEWLENLLHPEIRKKMTAQLEHVSTDYCILAIPLLLESGKKHPLVDRILVIDAPEHLQIERAKMRDEQSEEDIKAIMAHQVSREARQNAADDIIVNDRDLNHLRTEVDRLHAFYLKLAKSTD